MATILEENTCECMRGCANTLHVFYAIKLTCCRNVFILCLFSVAYLRCSAVQHGFGTLTGMEADISRWRSPMWQAGIAPTAAPSQLRLILLCQDRLAGLPLTAHKVGEWKKLDPPDTGCMMFGQYSDTTSHSTQYLTFKSRVFSV